MKVLAITSLFPNNKEPARGLYNKQQLSQLSRLCELKVVAPIPWHNFSSVPEKEIIDGMEVFHPRYLIIPKICRFSYGFSFFRSIFEKVKKIYVNFKFDLIYSPWAYPDGVGSYNISKSLKVPIVTGVLGSDINIYSRYFLRRRIIADALRNNQSVIAVSSALKERLVNIGVMGNKVKVLLNGVDTGLFKPSSSDSAKEKLGLIKEKRYVLFIGNLLEIKGLEHLIDAFKQVAKTSENVDLIIVGDGNYRNKLNKKTKDLNIDRSVHFVGRRGHEEIPLWLNSCDVLCLPSINEGCPNVILEALACGKPVVASRVGGIPEIINSADYGFLVEPANPVALSKSIKMALDKKWSIDLIRQRVLGFSWEENAKILFNELQMATSDYKRRQK